MPKHYGFNWHHCLDNHFWDEEAQKYIASSISKCIDIYVELANKGERYYLDGLYNCTAALYQYHKCINTAEKWK